MVRVRQMRRDDIEAAIEVVAEFDPHLNDEARSLFTQDLEQHNEWPESRLRLVAVDTSDRVVGTMGYGVGPLPTQSVRWTDWLMVSRSARRTGVGRALYAEIERNLVAIGCQRVYLDVGTVWKQPDAIAFHESCGYSIVATLTDYWAPTDDLVIMMKTLREEDPVHGETGHAR